MALPVFIGVPSMIDGWEVQVLFTGFEAWD